MASLEAQRAFPHFDANAPQGAPFEMDQERANLWASADESELAELVDHHTVAGIRLALVNLRDVADEHKRRAAAALEVEQRLRRILTRTSEVGLERPSFEEASEMKAEGSSPRDYR